MAVLGLCCFVAFTLVVVLGFPLQWLLLLQSTASIEFEGFSSWGSWAQ